MYSFDFHANHAILSNIVGSSGISEAFLIDDGSASSKQGKGNNA
jgi:hypothetical protein